MKNVYDNQNIAQIGNFTVSARGMILEADKAVAVLLGVSRCFLIGKPFSIFISKENQFIYYMYCHKHLESNSQQNYMLKFIRNDGSEFHAQVEYAINQDCKGKFKQFQIAVTNIRQCI
ncbi:PAS domain-containing protein [Desulfobacterales bacterium HSG17]|nr:PAS domain-containing protein [Desulfobacterales bacterium HSG17]